MRRSADPAIGSKARSVGFSLAAGSGYLVAIKDEDGQVIKSYSVKHLSATLSLVRTIAKDRRLRMEA